MEKVTRIAISLEPELLDRFDDRTKQQGYTNRSEAVRDLIRAYLASDEWDRGIGTVIGSITATYDATKTGLAEKVARIEHASNSVIHCSSLVRLDERNCIEVLIVQGSAFELQELANKIRTVKGVKHVQLTKTTVK